jgi:hypothetical protein
MCDRPLESYPVKRFGSDPVLERMNFQRSVVSEVAEKSKWFVIGTGLAVLGLVTYFGLPMLVNAKP